MIRRLKKKKGFTPLEISRRDRPFLTGFTLLEIVIALAVFSIGLVGILSLFPVGFQSAKRASDLSQATIYAQEKIEELKRGGYDNLPSDGDPTETGDFEDDRFSYELSVSTESTGLKELRLKVEWTEGGKNYNEEFITYVADLTP
jgi:prepilin-type N-terminal cleavage/methylation domain-containing protein